MLGLEFGGLRIRQSKDFFFSNRCGDEWSNPVQLWAVDTPGAIWFIYKHSALRPKGSTDQSNR